jgi:hypothetical protein
MFYLFGTPVCTLVSDTLAPPLGLTKMTRTVPKAFSAQDLVIRSNRWYIPRAILVSGSDEPKVVNVFT